MPTTTTVQTVRFSGRCNACIYPVVIERENVFGDETSASCPGCGVTVYLERLYGVYSDTNCDARCEHALGPICQCACGGANHQAGYILPKLTGVLPASVVEKYRAAHAKRQVAAAKRSAAKREAKAAAIADAAADFLSVFEGTPAAVALDENADLSVFPGLNDYALRTIPDIAGKLWQYGSLSDSQVDLVNRLIAEGAERVAKQAERAQEIRMPAPTGRVTFTGTVYSRRWEENDFGGAYKLKIAVKVGDATYSVFVNEPSKVEYSVGDTVTMTATVTRWAKDETVGFGKRPYVK